MILGVSRLSFAEFDHAIESLSQRAHLRAVDFFGLVTR